MGWFIRGHAAELDRDGILSRAEVIENAERMFEKMDTNKDDRERNGVLATALTPATNQPIIPVKRTSRAIWDC